MSVFKKLTYLDFLGNFSCEEDSDETRLENMDGLDETRAFTYFKDLKVPIKYKLLFIGNKDKYGPSVHLHSKLRMPARNFLEYVTLLESSCNKLIVLTR